MRIGYGYDVHRLVKNRKLILGGVEIPYYMGLLGYSDADVLTHAIIDALLGAAGLYDIGTHFPDNDSKFEGISSIKMLKETKKLISNKNFYIVNIDSTIVTQQPKIRQYFLEIRKNIARTLNCDYDLVNVKATTEEGLGFTGVGKGIASYAVALIEIGKKAKLKIGREE